MIIMIILPNIIACLSLTQANVEVLKGHLVRIHTGGLSKETKERVSQLAALQYRVDNTQDSKDEISL